MTTSRKLSCCVTIIATLAGFTFVFAKPKDKDKEANTEVKFTARTELVLVPALVTDKSGNHISGLKKEDFTVLENGAEQKIATCEEISSDPQRMSRPSDPNEFTNSLGGEGSNRRITLIVLDFVNTPFMAQARARQDLLKYLTQSLDQHEPTALYTFNRSGIQVIHDFTTDPRILVAALHHVNGETYEMVDSPEDVEAMSAGLTTPDSGVGVPTGGGGSKGGVGSTGGGGSTGGHSSKGHSQAQSEANSLQKMMQETELNFQSFEQRIAITYTLEAMQQVAQAFAGFPGRKSLIWASGGFPFNVTDTNMHLAPAGRDSLADVLPLYEHTWQLLNDAEISLYPVDVKGLQALSVAPASMQNGAGNPRNPRRNYGTKAMSREIDVQSSLQTFASMTGGRAYYNSNDLVKGFRDAVSDSARYYMLGYYIDHSNTKAGWRRLTVKVDRDHTDVLARSGFFVTDATVDPETSRNSDISSALQSPLDFTSLTLMARWDKTEPAKDPGKKHVNYEMHLAPDPTLINDADNNHVVMDFVALARTPDGKAVDHPVGQKVDVHLTPEKLSAIRQKGVAYGGALDLAPGEYTVRFLVRDDLSGRVGSVAAPLKVE